MNVDCGGHTKDEEEEEGISGDFVEGCHVIVVVVCEFFVLYAK